MKTLITTFAVLSFLLSGLLVFLAALAPAVGPGPIFVSSIVSMILSALILIVKTKKEKTNVA